MAAYLVTNVRILDGTGREPFAGAVRVEGNRIAEVLPGTGAALPPLAANGAMLIDGAGATLMPGLIESHAHLGLADLPAITPPFPPRSTCSSPCATRARCSTRATRARSPRPRPSRASTWS